MKKTIIITSIALCFAVVSSNANSAMNYNTSINVETVSKISPFCKAVSNGDLETVKKLIELGTDVNKKSNGMTPAMYAARYNRVEVLKLLILKGAKLEVKADNGFTAKRYAKISNATDALFVIEETLLQKAKA